MWYRLVPAFVFVGIMLLGVAYRRFMTPQTEPKKGEGGMRQRITSGLLLACILVPGFMYMKELVTGSVNSRTATRAVAETVESVSGWFTEKTAQAYEDDIATEEERLEVAIQEVEELLREPAVSGSTSQANQLRQYLTHLMEEREAVLQLKQAHLSQLNEKRIAHKEFELLKARDAAAQKQWPIVHDIVRLRTQQSMTKNRAINKQQAAVTNAFLNAIETGDVLAAKEMCAGPLKHQMTPKRIEKMAATAPKSAMTFQAEKSGVWTVRFQDDPKRSLTLVEESGEWMVAKAW